MWLVSPLSKLIGLIIILPFALTYLHLYYIANVKNEYCFVGGGGPQPQQQLVMANNNTTSYYKSANPYYGIYAPIISSRKNKNNLDKRNFQQRATWGIGSLWPSITKSSIILSSASSSSKALQQLKNNNYIMTFVDEGGEKKWCLQSTSTTTTSSSNGDEKWCSSVADSSQDDDDEEDVIYVYPPSGIWQSSSSSSSASTITSLLISCPKPIISYKDGKKKKKRGQQLLSGKQNQNIHFLLNQPSTVMLMVLNIYLAYYYWNYRICPSVVCKQYTQIVMEHDWWRGFSGALAHFEPLHIGFNVSSIYFIIYLCRLFYE